MTQINQKELVDIIDNRGGILLDVRRPDEWARGIIPNAKKINFLNPSEFNSEINKLDKSKSYVIYCKSGQRSAKACQLMDAIGFGETYNLQGGIMRWRGSIV